MAGDFSFRTLKLIVLDSFYFYSKAFYIQYTSDYLLGLEHAGREIPPQTASRLATLPSCVPLIDVKLPSYCCSARALGALDLH